MEKQKYILLYLWTFSELFSRRECAILDDISSHEIVHPEHLSVHVPTRGDLSTKLPDQRYHLDETKFKIKSGFGTFNLNLKRNRGLTSEQLNTWLHGENGFEEVKEAEHCYYQGTLDDDVGSRACMSTCDGLDGYLTTSQGKKIFITPVVDKSGKQQHILYEANDSNKDTMERTLFALENSTREMYPKISRKRRSSDLEKEYESELKIVDLAMVADYELYLKKGKNKDNVVKRLLSMANRIDEVYYKVFHTRVVVSHIVIQESLNQGFSVTNSLSDTLGAFKDYNLNTLFKEKKWKHDNAQLLSAVDFDGEPVGLAYLASMCSLSSVAVVQDFDPIGAINAMAHELGHNIGFTHTGSGGCTCSTRCIMDKSGYDLEEEFSKCSIDTYKKKLDAGQYDCLLDYPTSMFRNSCGDGILSNDEECDCGSPEECKMNGGDLCCDSSVCKLHAGKQCLHGPCCDNNCKFVSQGMECRANDQVCDLPEFCTGKSSKCPHNLYLQDGTACQADYSAHVDASGYCYGGACETLQKACKSLYGNAVEKGVNFCTEENNPYGEEFGNCGPTGLSGADKKYKPCADKDMFCGKLYCSRTGYVAQHPNLKTMPYYSYCVASTWTSSWSDTADPTYPKDGTKCGDGKVCVDQECKSFNELNTDTTCQCDNGGVCNSYGECHCTAGFACPYCKQPGTGGSFSSGAICTTTTECVDVHRSTPLTSCASMKTNGDCEQKPEYMKLYCKKTCDLCQEVSAVNGQWSKWSECGTCSKTCGEGECKRIRHCNNPPPSAKGNPCDGVSSKLETCNAPCPACICAYGKCDREATKDGNVCQLYKGGKWHCYLADEVCPPEKSCWMTNGAKYYTQKAYPHCEEGAVRHCVFPFKYKEKLYNKCIISSYSWCSTTNDYDKDRLWMNCPEGKSLLMAGMLIEEAMPMASGEACPPLPNVEERRKISRKCSHLPSCMCEENHECRIWIDEESFECRQSCCLPGEQVTRPTSLIRKTCGGKVCDIPSQTCLTLQYKVDGFLSGVKKFCGSKYFCHLEYMKRTICHQQAQFVAGKVTNCKLTCDAGFDWNSSKQLGLAMDVSSDNINLAAQTTDSHTNSMMWIGLLFGVMGVAMIGLFGFWFVRRRTGNGTLQENNEERIPILSTREIGIGDVTLSEFQN